MKKFCFSAAIAAVLCLSSALFAQDEFEEVEILDHPKYTLKNRFVIDFDLEFLPLDSYYKPILLGGAFSYQITDLFSWEIARFAYSLSNLDTGLNASIATQTPGFTIANRQPLKTLRFQASSTALLNIFYSKSNFFNRGINYQYWQVGLGVSYFDMDIEKQYGLTLSLRIRFFISEHTMVNLRAGHTVGFTTDAPNQISFIGLGGGFAL